MAGKDLEMLDPDAPHAAGPSLQRLKALDSLPDLKSQLETADELCNHGHRAEMIARWLTNKLQNDKNAATDAKTWRVLERCARLIAPPKISILLARFDFMAIVRNVVVDLREKKLARLLQSITDFIDLLDEISRGADGAGVRQMLSADSASAGSFLGVWIDRITGLLREGAPSGMSSDAIMQYAFSALRLWTMRKPDVSDGDIFAKDCLVPCTLMLQQLGSSTQSNESNKRRRATQSGGLSDVDLLHDLQVLIARHVFLPARSAFSQAGENKTSESTALGKYLTSVKSGIATPNGSQSMLCSALPGLLDIALRGVPMSTSRQRSKERPWVEHVFQELLGCLENEGKLQSQQALAGMLKVIGLRASLPAATLKDLVTRHSGLEDASTSKSVDFALIAEVVALDPTVFVDEAMADQLFPALTKAPTDFDDEQKPKEILVDAIAKPIMRAFAASRRLEVFSAKWQHELNKTDKSSSWTVWTELDDVMAELLETHLTIDQVDAMFDSILSEAQSGSHENKKSSKSSSPNDDLTSQAHGAGAVVLNALLKGLTSAEFIARLHEKLGALLHGCLSLAENSKIKSVAPHVWIMLGSAFRLWFPTWAVHQIDAHAVSTEAQSLLSHPAMSRILKARSSGKEVEQAEVFVGLLCSYLNGYKGCQQIASGLVTRLAESRTSGLSLALSTFPELLMLLNKDAREATVAAMRDLALALPSTLGAVDHQARLSALLSSALATSQNRFVDEVISAVLTSSVAEHRGKAHNAQQDALLQFLLQLPASLLTRAQRERILDWTTEIASGSKLDIGSLERLYALMNRLMQFPNATAKVSTDASVIWTLSRPSKEETPKKSKDVVSMVDTGSVAIFENIVHSLCGYLLATLSQDRSKSTLNDLLQTAVREMSSVDVGSTTSYGCLTIIKVLLHDMDSDAGKGLLSQLVSDSQDVIRDFADRTLEEVQSLVKALKKQGDIGIMEPMPRALLELLLVIRKSNILGASLADHDATLAKVCKKILQGLNVNGDATTPQASSSSNDLSVPAFSLLAHIKGLEACTSMGEMLLGSNMSPVDRRILVGELRQLAKSSQASDQSEMLRHILPTAQTGSAQSLAVLENLLSSMTKEDVAKDERTAHSLYSKLLEVLQQTKDIASYTAAISCLLTVIRDKPFILNQHLTEATLKMIQPLARSSPAERLIYLDLCNILSALFLHHRARLQGRFHLVTATLQKLQSRLFIPTKPIADPDRRPLSPRHARAYTRLLTLLCNPPTRTHSNSNSKSGKHNDLVDEGRRARANVGQYVPALLHSFCAQVLSGTLGEGVREALTPGLWAVIEAMEVHSPEAVKALSAAMNNSERAVLRSVYDDWKRFGRWEGA